jgi:opacity protein-like surface antigen
MKKILILLFFCSASGLYAQFQAGLHAGIAFNNTNNENDAFHAYENYTSFYPEIKVGYAFTRHWSFNLGIGFAAKGYEKITATPTETNNDNYKFYYFSLPLYISYTYPVNFLYGKVSAGLQPDFYNSQRVPAGEEIDSQRMKTTLGAMLGVEAGYYFTDNFSVHLSYRYNPSLTDADKSKDIGKFRSNYVMLGITYALSRKNDMTKEPAIFYRMEDTDLIY